MQKMNQTVFTKLLPSPAASALIRAAAHERHSISAGLELIKLSISDNPCLYTSPHSICSLVFTSLSYFGPAEEKKGGFLYHEMCIGILC